jgi:hypothetical protein
MKYIKLKVKDWEMFSERYLKQEWERAYPNSDMEDVRVHKAWIENYISWVIDVEDESDFMWNLKHQKIYYEYGLMKVFIQFLENIQ